MALENKTFTLTEDHIKLLQHMFVGWQDCEFGAPEIDPKRPYGDSDVYGNMAEILGIDGESSDSSPSKRQEEALRKIHEETKTALRVVLSTGSFKPGVYESDWSGYQWRRVSDDSRKEVTE